MPTKLEREALDKRKKDNFKKLVGAGASLGYAGGLAYSASRAKKYGKQLSKKGVIDKTAFSEDFARRVNTNILKRVYPAAIVGGALGLTAAAINSSTDKGDTKRKKLIGKIALGSQLGASGAILGAGKGLFFGGKVGKNAAIGAGLGAALGSGLPGMAIAKVKSYRRKGKLVKGYDRNYKKKIALGAGGLLGAVLLARKLRARGIRPNNSVSSLAPLEYTPEVANSVTKSVKGRKSPETFFELFPKALGVQISKKDRKAVTNFQATLRNLGEEVKRAEDNVRFSIPTKDAANKAYKAAKDEYMSTLSSEFVKLPTKSRHLIIDSVKLQGGEGKNQFTKMIYEGLLSKTSSSAATKSAKYQSLQKKVRNLEKLSKQGVGGERANARRKYLEARKQLLKLNPNAFDELSPEDKVYKQMIDLGFYPEDLKKYTEYSYYHDLANFCNNLVNRYV